MRELVTIARGSAFHRFGSANAAAGMAHGSRCLVRPRSFGGHLELTAILRLCNATAQTRKPLCVLSILAQMTPGGNSWHLIPIDRHFAFRL